MSGFEITEGATRGNNPCLRALDRSSGELPTGIGTAIEMPAGYWIVALYGKGLPVFRVNDKAEARAWLEYLAAAEIRCRDHAVVVQR